MKIFLIGFMGVGKTTIGKKLAAQTKYGFIDSDKYIEQKSGATVSEIFQNKGETAFRELEMSFLQSEIQSNTVVALGGGTPCYKNNMDVINQLGISIYLKMNGAQIANRLKHAKAKRPLIDQFKSDDKKLKEFISDKLKERETFYNRAHIKVDASNFDSMKLKTLIEMIQLFEQSHS